MVKLDWHRPTLSLPWSSTRRWSDLRCGLLARLGLADVEGCVGHGGPGAPCDNTGGAVDSLRDRSELGVKLGHIGTIGIGTNHRNKASNHHPNHHPTIRISASRPMVTHPCGYSLRSWHEQQVRGGIKLILWKTLRHPQSRSPAFRSLRKREQYVYIYIYLHIFDYD